MTEVTCNAIYLINNDKIHLPFAENRLHLNSIMDAGLQCGCCPVITGINLKRSVATVPSHNMSNSGLSQTCASIKTEQQ